MTKLTIKEEMRAIDKRDMGWWDTLTEDEQKKLGIYVLMRYVSATDSRVAEINEHYLLMTNDLVNVHFNLLRKHPQLQHRLLQAVGIGSSQMHPWIKPGKRKATVNINKKLFDFYLERYPHFHDDEVELALSMMTTDEITEMLDEAGLEKKQIREYLK